MIQSLMRGRNEEADQLIVRGHKSASVRRVVMLAGDVPDVLKLTFADGTTEQIEVERGRADQEFEDLRHHRGRYEGGWIIGESESEKWEWLNISTIVSVEIHRESDAAVPTGDPSQPEGE